MRSNDAFGAVIQLDISLRESGAEEITTYRAPYFNFFGHTNRYLAILLREISRLCGTPLDEKTNCGSAIYRGRTQKKETPASDVRRSLKRKREAGLLTSAVAPLLSLTMDEWSFVARCLVLGLLPSPRWSSPQLATQHSQLWKGCLHIIYLKK